MTKKEKYKAIYLSKPELVNDDVGMILYLMSRYFEKHHAEQLTATQRKAFRDMGNPEHHTRIFRILREKDEDIKKLVTEKAQEGRQTEYTDYKNNAKAHTSESYIGEDGYEYIRR